MQYPKNYKPKEIVSQTGFLCQTAHTKTPVFNRICVVFWFFTSSTTSSSSSTTTFSKIMWSSFEGWRILYNTVKNWNYPSCEKCFLHLKFFFWFHFFFSNFPKQVQNHYIKSGSVNTGHSRPLAPSLLPLPTNLSYIYIHIHIYIYYMFIYIHVEMCICNFLFLFVLFFINSFLLVPKKINKEENKSVGLVTLYILHFTLCVFLRFFSMWKLCFLLFFSYLDVL